MSHSINGHLRLTAQVQPVKPTGHYNSTKTFRVVLFELSFHRIREPIGGRIEPFSNFISSFYVLIMDTLLYFLSFPIAKKNKFFLEFIQYCLKTWLYFVEHSALEEIVNFKFLKQPKSLKPFSFKGN